MSRNGGLFPLQLIDEISRLNSLGDQHKVSLIGEEAAETHLE
jgi:hypothetical protein